MESGDGGFFSSYFACSLKEAERIAQMHMPEGVVITLQLNSDSLNNPNWFKGRISWKSDVNMPPFFKEMNNALNPGQIMKL